MKLQKKLGNLEEELDNAISRHDRDVATKCIYKIDDIIRVFYNRMIDIAIEPLEINDNFNDFFDNLQCSTTNLLDSWSMYENNVDDDFITFENGYIKTFNYTEFYNIYGDDILDYLYDYIIQYDEIDNVLEILKDF